MYDERRCKRCGSGVKFEHIVGKRLVVDQIELVPSLSGGFVCKDVLYCDGHRVYRAFVLNGLIKNLEAVIT